MSLSEVSGYTFTVRLDIFYGTSDEPGHLAGVRRNDKRTIAAVDFTRVFREHVECVGVEDEGLFCLADEFKDKFLSLWVLAQTGTNGEDGGSFEESFQAVGREVGAGDFAVFPFEHRNGH